MGVTFVRVSYIGQTGRGNKWVAAMASDGREVRVFGPSATRLLDAFGAGLAPTGKAEIMGSVEMPGEIEPDQKPDGSPSVKWEHPEDKGKGRPRGGGGGGYKDQLLEVAGIAHSQAIRLVHGDAMVTLDEWHQSRGAILKMATEIATDRLGIHRALGGAAPSSPQNSTTAPQAASAPAQAPEPTPTAQAPSNGHLSPEAITALKAAATSAGMKVPALVKLAHERYGVGGLPELSPEQAAELLAKVGG